MLVGETYIIQIVCLYHIILYTADVNMVIPGSANYTGRNTGLYFCYY